MLTLFFAFFTVFTSVAHAQLLPPPAEGEYQLRGEFSYFGTSANYGNDGSKQSLVGGAKLNTMMGLGEFIFDWTPEWRFSAGFTGGQTSADRVTAPSNVIETHTNIGVSEMWLGAQYWLNFASFDFVPDAAFYYPLFRVDTNSGDPLLGEGAIRMRGGAWLVYQKGDFRPFGYLGYEYMDEGRAGQMPYHVGVQWAAESGWWLQGELRGFQNITNDSNTDNRSIRDAYLVRTQGGSYRYYSINPSSHEFAVMAGTHFGQIGVYVGGAMTYAGKNSADGWSGVVGLTFDGTIFASTNSVSTPRYEDKFKVRAEKYDASLFRDSAQPVQQPAIVAPVRPRTRVRPKPAPVAKPAPAKPPTMPTVELLMKDTEKSLEKKGKGK